jgi:holo-[acyl-carrier protein] synthase
MAEDHADRFLERCFTPAEREHGRGSKRYYEHLAARFATKEATMKALGLGLTSGVSWTQIEVVTGPMGEPSLSLSGAAREHALKQGLTTWAVSLSHTDDLAIASVIASAGSAES